MGFLDRFFRREPAHSAAPAAPASSSPSANSPSPSVSSPPATPSLPPTIRVFDAYGRALFVPRDVFRTKVLPTAFQRDWSDADALARSVMNALTDGFLEETLTAARQLHSIDSDRARGATLLGANLLRLKRFKEAEAVLTDALKKTGSNGSVLVNIAAAQSGLGDELSAQKTLWQALQADPNLAFGLKWYTANQGRRGGEPAALAALRTVAALPGSWRAQLVLAGFALKAKENAAALAQYRQVLERLKVVPAEVLLEISGDLCKAGLVSDALELCAPRYVAAQHGMPAGGNLIQAYVVQKDAANARRLLAELYAIPRPDWREQLLKLELAIDQVDRGYGAVTDPKTLEMTMLVVARPLWMRDGAAFARHLPDKPADAVHVAFMSGSVRNPDTVAATGPVAKPSDGTGRFARAVPIYLAEQVHLRTDARTSLLVPWLRRGGFVLCGRPWTPDIIVPMNPKPDYLVLLHFDATQMVVQAAAPTQTQTNTQINTQTNTQAGSPAAAAAPVPMQVQWTLVRAIDEKVVASSQQPIRLDDDFASVRELTERLIRELATHADVAPKAPPGWLVPWSSVRLPAYCHALEQALAVHCAALVPINRPFLSGERNILDQLLDLSLREPTNVLARLLFLATLERESRLKSAIAAEYKARAERLEKEFPLDAPGSSGANGANGTNGGEGAELAKEVLANVVWE